MSRIIEGTPIKEQKKVFNSLKVVLEQYDCGLLTYSEMLLVVNVAAKNALKTEESCLGELVDRIMANRAAIGEANE